MVTCEDTEWNAVDVLLLDIELVYLGSQTRHQEDMDIALVSETE